VWCGKFVWYAIRGFENAAAAPLQQLLVESYTYLEMHRGDVLGRFVCDLCQRCADLMGTVYL
jgi:hypothetical protein